MWNTQQNICDYFSFIRIPVNLVLQDFIGNDITFHSIGVKCSYNMIVLYLLSNCVNRLQTHKTMLKIQYHHFKCVLTYIQFKGPFCDSEMIFLWNCSEDIDKISLFPNFQSIRRLCLRVTHILLYCSCCIGHTMLGIFHIDIINSQFSDYFTKQMDLQKLFCT